MSPTAWVVRVTVLDEVAGVVLLRVHRVHRDHGLAQVRVVDGVQERGELRNLVGLRADLAQGGGSWSS